MDRIVSIFKVIVFIEKLQMTLRVCLVNVLILVPFFFVSIYMFNKPFIEKINNPFLGSIDFWFMVCLCFCLSLLWFFSNLVLSAIVFSELSPRKNKQNHKEVFYSSVIYSVIYISVIILINYFCQFSFLHFIFACFSFVLIRGLLIFFFGFRLL